MAFFSLLFLPLHLPRRHSRVPGAHDLFNGRMCQSILASPNGDEGEHPCILDLVLITRNVHWHPLVLPCYSIACFDHFISSFVQGGRRLLEPEPGASQDGGTH